MSETINASPSPLRGKALLQKVIELSDLPRREQAKRCGYYTVTGYMWTKQVRINLAEFYDAVLEAQGLMG